VKRLDIRLMGRLPVLGSERLPRTEQVLATAAAQALVHVLVGRATLAHVDTGFGVSMLGHDPSVTPGVPAD